MPRVVPASPKQGLLAITMAAGILAGIACAYAYRGINSLNLGPRWEPFTEFGGAFLPALLWIAFITRVTARKRAVVLTTACFMFTLHMARIFTGTFMDPADNGARIASPMMVGFLVASMGIALISALIAWCVAWLLEKSHLAVIEQTGTLCWKCGYDVGELAQCPECGTERRERTPWAWRRWFSRACTRGRVVLWGIALLVVLCALPVIVTRTIPTWRFLHSMPGGEQMAGIVQNFRMPTASHVRFGPGMWIPFEPESNTGVTFAYVFEDDQGVPAMQAMVYTKTLAGTNTSFTPVSPTIWCDLTRGQAEWIVKYGVPPKFLEAMKRKYIDSNLRIQYVAEPPEAEPNPPEMHVPSLEIEKQR